MKETDKNTLKEYNEIVKDFQNSNFKCETEWTYQGDMFKKLSAYDNYTPIQTSCETILIKEL